MSDLLNQASLVMVPSGYKEDTVYSVVPSDGAGDLAFTRASNGTRVNSAGLVEVCPWNLLEYSEDFTNGVWALASATIGANATTAPNGTTTAESFTSQATSANHVAYQLVSYTGGSYTYSVYVKKANSRYVYIKLVGDASQWVAAVFDLNDGTLTKSEATGWTGLAASSESVGNGWYKLIVSGSGATSANFNVGIQYTNTGTPTFSAYADAAFTGTGTIDYYIWGAQLNIGSTAKPYFPTTDRLNVPRLTYQNGGGGCPSLLLEKQSTNVITTNIFTNWAKLNGGESLTSGIVDPAGTTQAYRLSSIPSGNYSYGLSLGVAFIVSAGSPFCYSVYLKGSGTIAITAQGSGFFAPTTITLTSVWTRYDLVVSPANAQTSVTFYISNATGTTATSVDMAFPQAELGSYCTSYIFTSGSSATRVADVCVKYSANSLIGQTEGTIYANVYFLDQGNGGASQYFYFNDGSSFSNSVVIGREPGTPPKYLFYINGNGANVLSNTTNALQNNFVKMAIGYKSGDWAAYLNGNLVASGTSTFSFGSALTRLGLGTNDVSVSITASSCQFSEAILFPTRLTNSELASLTTL